jgi:lipoprotein-releasing system permease protein
MIIGLRYLRAKRRQRTISLNTFISIAGITLGVAALIGTLGIMTGFKEDLQSKILGTTAHIIVQERGTNDMKHYTDVVQQIEAVPDVIAAAPFIFKQVLITSKSSVQGVILRGIQTEQEVQVTDLQANIKFGDLAGLKNPSLVPPESGHSLSGQAPSPSANRPGIILGKELSMRLGVFIGDSINVVSPVGAIKSFTMTPKIRPYTVVGIFESGMFEYDSSLSYISLEEAQYSSESEGRLFSANHCPTAGSHPRPELYGSGLDATESQFIFRVKIRKNHDVPTLGAHHTRGFV